MDLGKHLSLVAVILALACAAGPAWAEDDVEEDTTSTSDSDSGSEELTPRSKRRRLASTDGSGGYSELQVKSNRWARNGERDVEARLWGMAGVTSMPASSSDPSFVNIALQFNADIRFFRYLGIDLDVHGDLLSGKFTDGTATSAPRLSKEYRGGLANAKVQYPFHIGKITLIPRAGGGLGLQQLEYVRTAAATGTGTGTGGTTTAAAPSSTTVTMTAPFLTGGLEVELGTRWMLFVDYARSLTGTGTETGPTGNETEVTEASYDRWRIGGLYRLDSQWGLGAQFQRRSQTYQGGSTPLAPSTGTNTAGGSGTPTENSQIQFLGTVSLDL